MMKIFTSEQIYSNLSKLFNFFKIFLLFFQITENSNNYYSRIKATKIMIFIFPQANEVRIQCISKIQSFLLPQISHLKNYNHIQQQTIIVKMGSCQNNSRYSNHDGRKMIRDANQVQDIDQKKKRRKIKSQETIKKEVFALFEDYDTNKDGKLSLQELEYFLKELEKNKIKRSKTYRQIAQELFSTLDRNLSNSIEKEQFYEYYKAM